MDKPKGISIATSPKENPPSKEIKLTGHLALLYSKWTEVHGKAPAPIVLDENGNPVWLSRQERRARDAVSRKRR